MKNVNLKTDETTMNTVDVKVPRRLDCHTITDLVNQTSDLLKSDIGKVVGEYSPYQPKNLPVAITEGFETAFSPSQAPRIFVGVELEIHVHRVAHGLGQVLQGFTVFPRETLEVEISSRVKSTRIISETETILDSSETTQEQEFAKEVTKESLESKTNVTSWSVEGGGSNGFLSASASVDQTNTTEKTSSEIDRVLQRQGRKVSRSRKVEMRSHSERINEEEKIWRTKRSIHNPNYDKPIDVIVHESLGHLVYVIQVTSQTLIYQTADRKTEVMKTITNKSDLDKFTKQVAQNGKISDLRAVLKSVLTLQRKLDDTETGASKSYDPIVEKTYRPKTEFRYKSELLEDIYPLRVSGTVIGVNEIQIPTGDVMGRVRMGGGDARGELAKKLHEQSFAEAVLEKKLAEEKISVIKTLRKKVDESQGDEALKWAEMLSDAVKGTHLKLDNDSYFAE